MGMSNSDDEYRIAKQDNFRKQYEAAFGTPTGSGPNGEMTEMESAVYDYELRKIEQKINPDYGR